MTCSPTVNRPMITLTWDTLVEVGSCDIVFRRSALEPLDLGVGDEVEVHFLEQPVLAGRIEHLENGDICVVHVPDWVED